MRSAHQQPQLWLGEQCRENSIQYFAACLQAPTRLLATCQEHQRSHVQLQPDQQLFLDQQILCALAPAMQAQAHCDQELSLALQMLWKFGSVDSRLHRDNHLLQLFANTRPEQAVSLTTTRPTRTSQQVEIESCHPANWYKNL